MTKSYIINYPHLDSNIYQHNLHMEYIYVSQLVRMSRIIDRYDFKDRHLMLTRRLQGYRYDHYVPLLRNFITSMPTFLISNS